jgi:hypothetical protein
MKTILFIVMLAITHITFAQDYFKVTFTSKTELRFVFYQVSGELTTYDEDSVELVPVLEKVSYTVKTWKIYNDYYYDVHLPYEDITVVGTINGLGQLKLSHIYTTTKDKGSSYKDALSPDFSNLSRYIILYYDEDIGKFATIIRYS